MDNWGNKKGFNNNSGMLYTVQGLSSIKKDVPQFPNFKEYTPDYKNEEQTATILSYMRNGRKLVQTGVKRLKPLPVEGGDIRNEDINNI